MDSGDLVPDEIVLGIVDDRIDEDDCKNGFILDGFPRTIPQAEGLCKFMKKRKLPDFKCIELQVPDEIIVERLLMRGRNDDTKETILKRLEIYKRQTSPVKNYYKEKNSFYKVNGNKAIEEVFEDLKTIITS
jgi:adenylate kinase